MRRPQKFAQSASPFWRLLSKCQNHEADPANFCGLLRKAELYPFTSSFQSILRTCLPAVFRQKETIETLSALHFKSEFPSNHQDFLWFHLKKKYCHQFCEFWKLEFIRIIMLIKHWCDDEMKIFHSFHASSNYIHKFVDNFLQINVYI